MRDVHLLARGGVMCTGRHKSSLLPLFALVPIGVTGKLPRKAQSARERAQENERDMTASRDRLRCVPIVDEHQSVLPFIAPFIGHHTRCPGRTAICVQTYAHRIGTCVCLAYRWAGATA